MQYRKLVKNGDDVSLLGYGCMRYPMKKNKIDIDEVLTEEQLLTAIKLGINYFDTAYPYHGGKSEVILGNIINKHNLRDKIFIADKLPAYLVNSSDKIDKFFSTQLNRLNTTYIDYYLMHALDSYSSWERLKSLGILEFIEKKKKSGEIRYIGFSYHGTPKDFIRILEDYPWDFCQIQFNYLDENHQAGLAGLKRAYELGIGTVIMEPLRGGSLASKAPKKVKELFESYNKNRSIASWSLRFIFNHKEVSVVLSGMNDIEHIKDNVKTATETQPNSMTNDELNIINQVKNVYETLMKVPCTGCNYCMPCPFGVDIPQAFFDYNNKYFFNSRINRFLYIYRSVGGRSGINAGGDLCTGCGKCVKVCPQNINIPEKLKDVHSELDNFFIKNILKIVLFLTRKKIKK